VDPLRGFFWVVRGFYVEILGAILGFCWVKRVQKVVFSVYFVQFLCLLIG